MIWMLVAGALLSGISQGMKDRKEQKRIDKGQQHEKDLYRIKGDEDRRTIAFSAVTEDFYRRKVKDEKKQGYANWRAAGEATNVGSAQTPGGQNPQFINQLAGYQSKPSWQTTQGQTPPNPSPMYGHPTGSRDNPNQMYTFDQMGNPQEYKPKG